MFARSLAYRPFLGVALLTATKVAQAQVVVGFTGDVQAVPLSPWMSALTGIFLALGAWALLRKRISQGMSLLLLGGVLAAGLVVDSRHAVAGAKILPVTATDMVSSPTGPHGTSFYHVDASTCAGAAWLKNSTGVPIVITNITYVNGSVSLTAGTLYDGAIAALNSATSNAAMCTVGTHLAPGATCQVLYQPAACVVPV